MNTQVMRKLRRDLLDGRRPAACARCFMVEDLGMESHRQSENALWRDAITELVAGTATDGAIEANVRTADLRLGNVCNLRCRMCSPQSTRALLPEWASFHGVPLNHHYFDRFRGVDWFEDPAFWQRVEDGAPGLERINFAGGEPLLIRGMFDFLERIVASGRAPSMTISYNTNLTVLPERVRTLWPHFAAIRVTVSIDGVGAVNDYIRYPSRWEEVRANLLALDAGVREFNLGAGLSTNTAVQVCNVFRLGELLDFLANELHHFEVPNLSIVTQPEHLDVRILPPEIKAIAAERLTSLIATSSARWRERWGDAGSRELVAAINGVATHMAEAGDAAELTKFRRWSEHLDRSRGQNTVAVVPELAAIFAA